MGLGCVSHNTFLKVPLKQNFCFSVLLNNILCKQPNECNVFVKTVPKKVIARRGVDLNGIRQC